MKAAFGTFVLAALAGLAHADELPHRRPGLWAVVSQPSNPQQKPTTHRLCLDRDTEALANRMSVGTVQQACAKNDMHVTGNRITMHAVCSFGNSQQTSDAVITFSGDSSYRADVHARFEPPMMGTGETHTLQEGKWVGACPADMQPGDMVITDGRGREMRVNLRKMLQSHP
jgi:hypothetical protein